MVAGSEAEDAQIPQLERNNAIREEAGKRGFGGPKSAASRNTRETRARNCKKCRFGECSFGKLKKSQIQSASVRIGFGER